MKLISNYVKYLGPKMNELLSPKKSYDETHHSYKIFVRKYGDKIVGFGSSHMHHSNCPERIASIKASIDLELKQLNPGAMVLLEGGGNSDTQDLSKVNVEKLERDKNSSEMSYAFLKVCELKAQGKDINAMYVEPNFSDQINFLIDRKVPPDLIFSYLIIRNIPAVLHDLAKDAEIPMNKKCESIKTVDDFIDISLTRIQAKGGELTPADSFQLSFLLNSINDSKYKDKFTDIIQENGRQKSDRTLLGIAFNIAKANFSSAKLESIITNSNDANEFTAPINEYNLKAPELVQLQRELDNRHMYKDSSPINQQKINLLFDELEEKARPILDRLFNRFNHFDNACMTFMGRYGMSKFNVIASILNISREQGIKDRIDELLPNHQIMVMFGAGHIRSLHSYFLKKSS